MTSTDAALEALTDLASATFARHSHAWTDTRLQSIRQALRERDAEIILLKERLDQAFSAEVALVAATNARIEAVTKEAADAVFDVTERMIGLEDELEAEIRRTDALVEALPKCDTHSDRPATRAFKRGGARFCDDCGVQVMGPVSTHRVDVPTYLHTEPLRAIAKARAAPPRVPLSDCVRVCEFDVQKLEKDSQ